MSGETLTSDRNTALVFGNCTCHGPFQPSCKAPLNLKATTLVVVDHKIPERQQRGSFHYNYHHETLRKILGV